MFTLEKVPGNTQHRLKISSIKIACNTFNSVRKDPEMYYNAQSFHIQSQT